MARRPRERAQLQAMTEMQGEAMQLRFPDSIQTTKRILNYMHKCIGIDIAAYTGKDLIMLKQSQTRHSPMLRLASGQMTQTESALLALYASSYTLARLYPLWFDMRLSQKIYESLQSNELKQFSGTYRLLNNNLWLDNITLNGKALDESWLMADASQCR